MKNIILFYLIFSSVLLSLENEQEIRYYWGLGAGYSLVFNNASFAEFPGFPNCCTEFGNTTGNGLYLDFIFIVPIGNNLFLDTRLGLLNAGSNFTENDDPIGNVITQNSGNPVTQAITVDHIMQTGLNAVHLSPSVFYKIKDRLRVSAGLDLAYLTSVIFTQEERLDGSLGYVFQDTDQLVRNPFTDVQVPNVNSLQYGISLGIGYEFKLNNNNLLIPEIKYIHRFSEVSNVNWSFNELRFGISFNKGVLKKEGKLEKDEEIYNRDTTEIFVYEIKGDEVKLKTRTESENKIETEDQIITQIIYSEIYEKQVLKSGELTADIEVYGLEEDGSKTKHPKIIIEETETEEAFPVLPYVFFENNTAKFRDTRLLEKSSDFSEDSLKSNVYDIYRNNLNILAARAKENDSQINLIADYYNNKNESILNERLNNIEAYLVDTWGINPSKINSQKRESLINQNGRDLADLIQESNKVEVQTDDDILRPVFIQRIERKSNPPAIEIKVASESNIGDAIWDLDVSQENNEIRSYRGKNDSSLKWNIIREPSPRIEKPINLKLVSQDNQGNIISKEEEIQLNQLTLKKKRYELENDKRIQKYSLIVFDFNSAELTPLHRKIISDIKSRISPESVIKIYGYTDRVGEDNYNLDLSKRRTENVAKEFQSLPNQVISDAFGNSKIIYDNELPEGRSLSRTVQIIIETPFSE